MGRMCKVASTSEVGTGIQINLECGHSFVVPLARGYTLEQLRAIYAVGEREKCSKCVSKRLSG